MDPTELLDQNAKEFADTVNGINGEWEAFQKEQIKAAQAKDAELQKKTEDARRDAQAKDKKVMADFEVYLKEKFEKEQKEADAILNEKPKAKAKATPKATATKAKTTAAKRTPAKKVVTKK